MWSGSNPDATKVYDRNPGSVRKSEADMIRNPADGMEIRRFRTTTPRQFSIICGSFRAGYTIVLHVRLHSCAVYSPEMVCLAISVTQDSADLSITMQKSSINEDINTDESSALKDIIYSSLHTSLSLQLQSISTISQ